MRGLDTNVLVRYLTRDEASQFATASELIEGAERRGERLYVNVVVLCELTWVLRGSRYRLTRSNIAETVEKLLDIPLFEVESRDQALAALDDYRAGEGDFAGYLIGRQNLAAGCQDTATFDTHLAGCGTFEVLGSA